MGVFSMNYICTALLMYWLQTGDAALVYANIVNLFARIVYSLHFVTTYFSMHGASDLLDWSVVLPKRKLLLLVILSALLIWLSQRYYDIDQVLRTDEAEVIFSVPVLLHTCLGGLLASICISTWWTCSGRALTVTVPTKSD
jgi:oligosaccharide translocation protein RFT1